MVALRKEGVDRNYRFYYCFGQRDRSPSARRAWIEISVFVCDAQGVGVALRKEGVDRNALHSGVCTGHIVALRKEGVDRNLVFPV